MWVGRRNIRIGLRLKAASRRFRLLRHGFYRRDEKTCKCGKVIYRDEDSARAALAEELARVVKVGGVGPKGKLGIYQCSGSWHLGNSRYRVE